MKVYLGGAINGCTDSECNDWRERAIERLGSIETINPMVRDYRGVEQVKFKEIVEFDKQDIDKSDILLISYLKPSVGTSMEILYGWERKKTIYLFTDQENLSPWLLYHTTRIFENLEDAIGYVYTEINTLECLAWGP